MLGGAVAPDTLRVVTHGSRLQLFVDDELVATVRDATFDHGDVGVWLHSTGARRARVFVQHLRVSTVNQWP